MTTLLSLPITAAVTAQASAAIGLRQGRPSGVSIQYNFTYGSGGTNATSWVQTSFDGGATWCDVAQFQFTTASAIRVFNVTANTPQAATAITPTDGTLGSNIATDGLVGPLWRTKTTTTGTYAGGTSLRIDITPTGLAQAQ